MTKLKIGLSSVLALITAKLGILAMPVYTLVFLNIADYTTGISAAYYKGEKISSKTGFRGIAKKICMWLLIAVGVVVDKLLIYTASAAKLNIPEHFAVGCFVAVWLLCNEVISILENISNIGVKVPVFLKKTIKLIKEAVENNNSPKSK